QQFDYAITCTSDEYLLNVKSVSFIPAFIARTQGEIISALAETLCPGYFDTTSFVSKGDLVPFFQYDPRESFSQIVKKFADGARFCFKARDKILYYQPFGDGPLGIVYDESKPQSTFHPKGLNTTIFDTPIVNDVT